MQDLIQELQLPRTVAPSPASLRAAKALQELSLRAAADLRGRLDAEQKLAEAFGEIQELRRQLNEATTAATASAAVGEPGVSETKTD